MAPRPDFLSNPIASTVPRSALSDQVPLIPVASLASTPSKEQKAPSGKNAEEPEAVNEEDESIQWVCDDVLGAFEPVLDHEDLALAQYLNQ